MPGLGTLVNAAAIVAGGILGLFAKGLFKENMQKILNVALSLSVIALALSGLLSKMLVLSEGTITTRGTYMLIFSLVLGGILGEVINVDGNMTRFGEYLKKKTGNAKDAAFVDGFVSASLTVCIGAMAVMGSVMDGIEHDPSILFTKAILDFIIVMVMAASKGKGCLFSAVPVAIFQGSITLLAALIAPILSDLAMANLSLVGSVLILCIGVNLMADGAFRIKVANLLPSIVLAVLAAYIPFFD